MDFKPHYMGFWWRLLATLIDTALLLAISLPLLWWIYGPALAQQTGLTPHGPADIFISYVMPVALTLLFWRWRSATPGKMLIHAMIVDATTLQTPSMRQWIVRYFAYLISLLPFCLGFLWIAFDARKQGFHDKIAHTVVIRKMP